MDSRENNWHVVSDTSYPGYMDVPKYVMQGYTILASEISEQIDGVIPTHVFLPGGVGGIAAAVSAELWRIWGKNRPKVIVVEPRAADCLYQSALSEKPTNSCGNLETVMACLSAGEVSLLAWDILSRSANTFMILSDETIAPSMRRLAKLGVVSGESGAATLAGLAAICQNPTARMSLDIDHDSRILLLSTEGATDPEIYKKLVGVEAGEIVTNHPI
jgi:diaminopropionate ammonia-lyase